MNSLHGKEIVDAHIHLWDSEKFFYPWPTADLTAIFRPFRLSDLETAINPSPVRKVIFVQANQTYEETDWILELAKQNSTICGVVGWVDLTDPKLDVILDNYMKHPKFRGVRHIVEAEADDWLNQESVHRGLGFLQERGLTYDLLIRTRHLKLANDVVKKFPNLKFVIDHAAKPEIKEGKMDAWKSGMELLAENPNVFCKISGLVTEASHENWKVEDLIPYVQQMTSIFGAGRCMFGSDWPVCNLARDASYSQVFQAYLQCVSHLSDEEKEAVFCDNVVKFYGLQGRIDN
ncbi:L-fucono-1,5-lactonase-like [Oculina patagonica]